MDADEEDPRTFMKIIAVNDEDEKHISYVEVHLLFLPQQLKKIILITNVLEPKFFPNDYELFWLDDENDKIVIKTVKQLKVYVEFMKEKNAYQDYVKVYATPIGYDHKKLAALEKM